MLDYLKELQGDVDRIVNAVPVPPDWRKTKIGNNQGGIVADVKRLSNPEWWRKSANQAEQSLSDLLKRAGLGTLDGDPREETENYREAPVTAAAIAERQRDKAQRRERSAADEGEKWREYLGELRDDARAWLAELGKKLDMNTPDNRGFFSALKGHIDSQKQGARIGDLNQPLIELCLRALCTE
jgi:hypothetical protein